MKSDKKLEIRDKRSELKRSFSLRSTFYALRSNVKPVRGFTLIELLVSTAIFAVVVTIAVGALLSLVTTNKRAQAIHSVMNNVNAAMDTMVRNIAVGYNFYCGTSVNPPSPSTLADQQDCLGGGILLGLEPYGGSGTNDNDQIVYRWNETQKNIERSLSSGSGGSWVAITAPEITITELKFYVTGAEPLPDDLQPRVLIIMKGEAPLQGGEKTDFSIQTTVTQRLLDI